MANPYSTGRRGVKYGSSDPTARAETDIGARALYELSKRLKEVGGTGKGSLRNEMQKALRRAAKPLPKAVKAAASERLPRAGGLNDRIAKRTPRVSTLTGAKTAGIRIQDKKTDPRMSLRGRIPHPVFGRRGKAKNGGKNFVIQVAPKVQGYFDQTLRDEGPEVRRAIVNVMAEYAQKIARPL